MKSKKALSAASYPSRIFENYQMLNDSGYLVVCQELSINVATGSKNKETAASLFFSRRQCSKVIARVTRKSLRTFSDNLRAYLALAGGCDHWAACGFRSRRSQKVRAAGGDSTSSPGGRFRYVPLRC